uniref:Protein phosphatase 1, regulatory (Inhibitor) subunit 1B n=1 Tax=Nothobranchius korthausae TaxID=1143690 RepID=A0A1A8EKT3_9TELE
MCKIRRHVLGFVASLYIWGPVIISEDHQETATTEHFPSMTAMTNETETPKEEDEEDEEEDEEEEIKLEKNRRECN